MSPAPAILFTKDHSRVLRGYRLWCHWFKLSAACLSYASRDQRLLKITLGPRGLSREIYYSTSVDYAVDEVN